MDKRPLLIGAAAAALIAAALVLKASFAQNHLAEPARSYFYVNCVTVGGLPVTTCMCLEKDAVAKSGINHIKAKGDDENAQKFMDAVNASLDDCKQQTMKQIADDLSSMSEDIIDNAPGSGE